METLKQIENKLKDIALSNNLVGDSVDLLIKLLSYTHYESLTSTRVSLLEALPSRAINLNSKIEHAMNEMYSIHRGINSHIRVKVKVTGNISLKKFDKVYSDRRNSFYYLETELSSGDIISGDYTFSYGQEYILTLIKSEGVIIQELGVLTDNKFMVETLNPGVSETYELKEGVGSPTSLLTTKDFSEHLETSLPSEPSSKLPRLFDLTTTNYGVRFYSPDSSGFNTSINYQLKYLPYSDSEVDETQLNKLILKGFEVDHSTIVVTPVSPPETISNLLYNLKREAITQSRVRSNDDVVDEFKSKFGSKIVDASLGDYDYQNDIMTLNYIPLNSNSPLGVPSPQELQPYEEELYKESLLYYVTKNINFEPMYDHSNSIPLYVDISMFIGSEINVKELTDKIESYEYKLGGTINLDELLGFINNLEGVKYAMLDVKDLDGNNIVGEITANKNEYFLLSDNFTYSYKL